jgi:hypothetical protein
VLEQDGLTVRAALINELSHGLRSLEQVSGGVERFRAGHGRHGSFEDLGDEDQGTR